MDVLATITRAAELYELANELYESAKPSIESMTGPRPSALTEAQKRLDASITRAHAARANLDAAIKARLGDD